MLALLLLSAAAGLVAEAQTFTTLVDFKGRSNGGSPYGPPIQGTNGDFYGATFSGGTSHFYGTIYRMTPQGHLKTLYSFCCYNNPFTALALGADGSIYGAASDITGSIFKITPSGTLTTVYSFGNGEDGSGPLGGLILADGNFYGTAAGGGANVTCPFSEYGSGCAPSFK